MILASYVFKFEWKFYACEGNDEIDNTIVLELIIRRARSYCTINFFFLITGFSFLFGVALIIVMSEQQTVKEILLSNKVKFYYSKDIAINDKNHEIHFIDEEKTREWANKHCMLYDGYRYVIDYVLRDNFPKLKDHKKVVIMRYFKESKKDMEQPAQKEPSKGVDVGVEVQNAKENDHEGECLQKH